MTHRLPRSAYGRRKAAQHTVAPPPEPPTTPTETDAPSSPFKVLQLDSPDGGAMLAEVTFTLRDRGISIATDGAMTTTTFAAIFIGIWAGLDFDARFATSDLIMDVMLHDIEPASYPPVNIPVVSQMIATALRTARTNGGIFVPTPECTCPECTARAAAETEDTTS